MRTAKLVFMLLATALTVRAQQPAPLKSKAASPVASKATDPADQAKRYENALTFVQASDARQRLDQSLDGLLDKGKQSMLLPTSGLDPQFADEWVKRMRQRINLDDYVNATARVYALYFTSDELVELTKVQLALKKSRILPLSPELDRKMKSNSPRIQHDINAETSPLGSRLSAEIGKEIEREHPDWVKPATPANPTAAKP